MGVFTVVSLGLPDIQVLLIYMFVMSSLRSLVKPNAYPEYVDPISMAATMSGWPPLADDVRAL